MLRPQRKRLPDGLDVLFIAGIMMMLTVWSWGRWLDVLIDFGKELYMPWQVAEGAVLYRDIAHFLGPFSVYFNTLIFKLFGTSLLAVALSNSVWLFAACLLLRAILRNAGYSRGNTLLGCTVFLSVFGFGHLLLVGNYNFICPYTHEASHGFVLGLGSLWAVTKFQLGKSKGWISLAGLLAGLTLVTRTEPAVATWAALTVSTIFTPTLRSVWKSVSVRLASWALLPLLVSFIYFSVVWSPVKAVAATFAAWQTLLFTSVSSSYFFQRLMGLDDPQASLLRISLGTFWVALVLATIIGADFLFKKFVRTTNQTGKKILHGGLLLGFSVLGFSLRADFNWQLMASALPALTLGLACYFWRMRQSISLTLCVFGLVLLLKIIGQVQFAHYGFYLAAGATVLLLVTLIEDLPKTLRRLYGGGGIAQHLMILLVVFFAGSLLRLSNVPYTDKILRIGTGGDTFFTYNENYEWRGQAVQDILQQLSSVAQPHDTLAVLPEGIMINYLSRLKTTVPYLNLMPTEMLIYGEGNVLADFQKAPPTFILWLEKDVQEYGYNFFGFDPQYGQKIMEWVEKNYTLKLSLPPPQGEATPFLILYRKS